MLGVSLAHRGLCRFLAHGKNKQKGKGQIFILNLKKLELGQTRILLMHLI